MSRSDPAPPLTFSKRDLAGETRYRFRHEGQFPQPREINSRKLYGPAGLEFHTANSDLAQAVEDGEGAIPSPLARHRMWCYPWSVKRAVIDTNVVFEGLTTKGGAAGLVIDTWLTEMFRPCISNSLAYEYQEVLESKLTEQRWQRLRPVLGGLLRACEYIPIHFSWRPLSPDPGDDHVIDCAMNAAALVVTWNVRDFRLAERALGLPVLTPIEFLEDLALNESR